MGAKAGVGAVEDPVASTGAGTGADTGAGADGFAVGIGAGVVAGGWMNMFSRVGTGLKVPTSIVWAGGIGGFCSWC